MCNSFIVLNDPCESIYNKLVAAVNLSSYGKLKLSKFLRKAEVDDLFRVVDKKSVKKYADDILRKTPNSLLVGKADTYVYLGKKDGKTVYVGITNNLPKRQSKHGKRFKIEKITQEPMTRRQALAIEQVFFENNRVAFKNLNNPISKKNNKDWYDDAIEYGKQWMKENGFEDFLNLNC